MFQKLWHGTLIAAIVMYAGNIFFATEPCSRIEKSGSVVRVVASGLFFLTDNWMNKSEQTSVRTTANSLDQWLQGVVKVTFFGKDMKCPAPGEKAVAAPTQNASVPDANSTPKSSGRKVVPVVQPDSDTQPIVNTNPYNLPSLPEPSNSPTPAR